MPLKPRENTVVHTSTPGELRGWWSTPSTKLLLLPPVLSSSTFHWAPTQMTWADGECCGVLITESEFPALPE